MNRRNFIILSILLPLLVPSNSHGFAQFFARRLLRYAFRTLTRRSFSRFSVRMVGRSISRTNSRIYRPNRIQKTFGKQRYNITGKNGRILGTAQVEGEVMVLRNAQGRMLGYIQAEGKGLAVYDGAGNRAALFKQKNNRIIAYNKDEDYFGQIIEDMVEDQIKSYFIDRYGVKHDSVPVEFKTKDYSVVITDKNTRIVNGKLEILDSDNILIMYGVHEENDIRLYDLNNSHVATIKKQDGILTAYDKSGNPINNSKEIGSEFINIEY